MADSTVKEIMLAERTLHRLGNIWIDHGFSRYAEMIQECPADDDDVIAVSYPKSGSSWMRRIISLIIHGGDVQKAEAVDTYNQMPFVEAKGFPDKVNSAEPRYMTTHLPYQFLPQVFRNGKGKIIYLMRNPKDIAVSYYHTLRSMSAKFDLTFEEYFQRFINGQIFYGSWFSHVTEYWHHRGQKNMLLLKYEELHKDLEGKVREIADFIKIPLTDEQIRLIAKMSRFEIIKDNPAVNNEVFQDKGYFYKGAPNFMRKGIVGDWKATLTPEMNKVIEERVTSEITPLGLEFQYE